MPSFKTFTTLLLLFISFLTYSQEESLKGKFNIGVQGGPQFTNVDISNFTYEMNSKTGYTVGVFGEYFFSNELKIRFGCNIDNRKYQQYKNQASITAYDYDSILYTGYSSYYLYQNDYSLNYLTFPLNVIYQKGNERVKVFVQFGLYYSLLLNAAQDGSSDLYIDPVDAAQFIDPLLSAGHHLGSYTGSAKSQYNNSDFGVNFYIGGWFKISDNLSATFSPGITYGISNVFSIPEWDSKWGSIVKLDAGIVYNFGR